MVVSLRTVGRFFNTVDIRRISLQDRGHSVIIAVWFGMAKLDGGMCEGVERRRLRTGDTIVMAKVLIFGLPDNGGGSQTT